MIISTVCLKGGGGKTTTAINLAVYFANKNKSVILVDADVNNNLSNWDQVRETNQPDAKQIDYVVLNTVELFKTQFDEVVKDYDIVVIDGRPAIDSMAGIILQISDLSIFPIKASPLDMWTNNDVFIDTYQRAKEVNPALKGAFILSDIEVKTHLYRECRLALHEFKSFTDIITLKSYFSHRNVYKESLAYGLGAIESKNYTARGEVKVFGEEVEQLLKS